jgi:hypothetical protein
LGGRVGSGAAAAALAVAGGRKRDLECRTSPFVPLFGGVFCGNVGEVWILELNLGGRGGDDERREIEGRREIKSDEASILVRFFLLNARNVKKLVSTCRWYRWVEYEYEYEYYVRLVVGPGRPEATSTDPA